MFNKVEVWNWGLIRYLDGLKNYWQKNEMFREGVSDRDITYAFSFELERSERAIIADVKFARWLELQYAGTGNIEQRCAFCDFRCDISELNYDFW